MSKTLSLKKISNLSDEYIKNLLTLNNIEYEKDKSSLNCYNSSVLFLKADRFVINSKNDEGETLLMLSCKKGDYKTVNILLKNKNIDVNLQDNKGYTALMYASCSGEIFFNPVSVWIENTSNYQDIVRMLLNVNNINVNLKNNEEKDLFNNIRGGNNALMLASNKLFSEIISLLLKSNIDVNDTNMSGDNALTVILSGPFNRAYTRDDRILNKTVKLLIDAGIDINHKNNGGKTIFDLFDVEMYRKHNKKTLKTLRDALKSGKPFDKEDLSKGLIVKFKASNGIKLGKLVYLNPKKAKIQTPENSIWDVPYVNIVDISNNQKEDNKKFKKIPSKKDFKVGQILKLKQESDTVEGMITKLNPKKIIVTVGDKEYSIPYLDIQKLLVSDIDDTL